MPGSEDQMFDIWKFRLRPREVVGTLGMLFGLALVYTLTGIWDWTDTLPVLLARAVRLVLIGIPFGCLWLVLVNMRKNE